MGALGLLSYKGAVLYWGPKRDPSLENYPWAYEGSGVLGLKGLGARCWGFGNFGVWVQGLRFRGLGSRIWGLGFRLKSEGLGLGA